MPTAFPGERTDTASRMIRASPHTIYTAFLDPKAIAAWRPPQGMICTIYTFEPHQGGHFRMAYEYTGADHPVSGKTAAHADGFHGQFLELVPDQRIVELVEFESADPAFAGTMIITTRLEPVTDGTQVTILCRRVPVGIHPPDHQLGITISLQQLAAYTE